MIDMYVGIDQSLTNFAACALWPDDPQNPRMLTVKPKTRGARRLWELRDALSDFLEADGNKPTHIVMEGYAYSRQMGHVLGECGGMVKLALLDLYGVDNQLAYPTIPTTQQLKMFCGLPGNAQKNLMLKAVLKKWGMDFNDDNQADAYGLAQMAASLTLGARFEYEKTVLAKVIAKTGVHTEWEVPKLRSGRAKKTSSA